MNWPDHPVDLVIALYKNNCEVNNEEVDLDLIAELEKMRTYCNEIVGFSEEEQTWTLM